MPSATAQFQVEPAGSLTIRDWVLILMVGLAAGLPLYIYGVPFVGDLPHHYRTVLGFYESILSGNFYPSWHPSTNGGYGDPSVRFYPPALYFLLCGARLIARDWFFASLFTYVLLGVVGSLGMYLWVINFTTRRYAWVAGLLFLFSPFHANEMYQAGMFGQYAAANLLPFVFAFVERIIRGTDRRNVAALALSYGLLILFHVPLAVIGSISVAIYALIRLIQSHNFERIYGLSLGVVLGVALSCFYWVPVMREIRWKSPSGIGQGAWFDYKNNFLFGPSPSVMSNFLLPLLAVATIVMAGPVLVLLLRRRSEALAAGVVAVLGLFISTRLSKPIWDLLPVLQETQFPWRWMTITSACLSMLVTLSLPELFSLWKTKLRPVALILIGLVVIALSFTILQLIRGAPLFPRAEFNQKVEAQRGSPTNQDFLPVWTNARLLQPMNDLVVPRERKTSIVQWTSEHKVFTIEAGLPTEVRVKTLYYPLWIGTANGRPVSGRADADGALLISVPGEASTVDLRFTEPATSRISGVFSACTLLLLTGLFVVRRRLR